jgi:hypothetical protein
MKYAKNYWKLIKNSKKKSFEEKKFLVKNKNFWPIVGDGICPKLSFGLFLVTMDHKFVLNVKKSAKNGQFTMKVIKNITTLYSMRNS